MKPIVNYLVARETPLPPIDAAMYEYVLGANGLFVRGKREGLRAMLPVAPCLVRGLAQVEPYVELSTGGHTCRPVSPLPHVPAVLVAEMLRVSLSVKDDAGLPVEAVFHLNWDGVRWQLEIPAQEQSPVHVQPAGPAIGSSYSRALIIAHSHHEMPPVFSTTDDAEDTGFRVVGVLGSIFTRPALRVRACLYGNRWDIPAAWIFQLPPGIADCVALERGHDQT